MRIRLALLLGVAAALLAGRETAAWHVGRGAVTDGDTVKIGEQAFRLKGVAAPERGTPEGAAARAFAKARFQGRWLLCRETGRLTFSRYEAFCYTLTGEDLGGVVIRAGLACASSDPRWRVAGYGALERPGRPTECGPGA